jgi:hypothetical protein
MIINGNYGLAVRSYDLFEGSGPGIGQVRLRRAKKLAVANPP